MRVIVVIPHHLPTLDFLNEWGDEFANSQVEVIIVNDRPKNQLDVWPDWGHRGHITIFTHADIVKDLGKNAWIIPTGTSAIRSYGLWKAWQRKPDMIVTLDNDCFPDVRGKSGRTYFIDGHWNNLQTATTLDWVYSHPTMEMPSRGFPYMPRGKNKVYVSHGVWSNIPDLDAAQMLLHPDYRTDPVMEEDTFTIPRYNFYPMCGMNLAFRPEATPLMYFGLFGAKYGFDQFDDIWAGVFSKKVMDHLGWAVKSGYPSVEHRKQSNAFANFKKQAGGLEYNEWLWKEVQNVYMTGSNPIDCYREILSDIDLPDRYWTKVAKATSIWLSLFE